MRPWLAKAEEAYGVDPAVLMGVWGMESEFGVFTGGDLVIRALASLAFVHYQGDYFRDELIAALAILEEGDVAAARHEGLVGGRDGPDPVHAVELPRLRGRFRGPRPPRHLGQRARRDRLDRQLSSPSTAGSPARHGDSRCGCRKGSS